MCIRDRVIALFRRATGLHRRRAIEQRRIPLVRFAADESVEMFEAAATGRPRVGGPSSRIGGNFVSGSFASYVIRPVRGRSGIGRTVLESLSRSLMVWRNCA